MKIPAAIIGLGHGQSYLHLLERHPDFRLAAVVDRDSSRFPHVLARQGNSSVATFTSVEELINSRAAAAVFIALPTPLHAPVSVACLDAGLDVLQEKPLCRTDEEAKLIAAAVARSGKAFQVGYEVRSSPMHQSIMKLLKQNDLGRVTNVWYNQHCMDKRTLDEWRSSRANMGGKLFDCAVHYLDLMQQWAGAPVHRLVALGNQAGKVGPCTDVLPDSASISIEYANGVRGTYNFGGESAVNDDSSFGVVGTTGRIMGNPWLPEGAGSYELRMNKGVIKSQVVFDGKLTSTGHLGFSEEVDAFANLIVRGGPNPCTISDAVAIHKQMVAIDQSLASGQVVQL